MNDDAWGAEDLSPELGEVLRPVQTETPGASGESEPQKEDCPHRHAFSLVLSDVVKFHTQHAHVYNPEVVRPRNLAYHAHMETRTPQLRRAHFHPTAVFVDSLLGKMALSCAEVFNGIDTSSLDDTQTTALIATITRAFEANTAATLAAAGVGRPCHAPGHGSPLNAPPPATEPTGGAGSLSPAPPTAAGPAASARPSVQPPLQPPAAAAFDPYARLAQDSTGQPGLGADAIGRKRRDDARRNGDGAMKLITGAHCTAGADGVRTSDEGKVAHRLVAAYVAVEADRRMHQTTHVERVEAFRRQMVAHHGKAEAVIGRDGMRNGKGELRLFSRSFMYSLVHHPTVGAELRWIGTDEEEARKTGAIGDEWTFDGIDALLLDPRVCPELKQLLRHSDALLMESELAEAELVLGYRSEPAIQIKVVGSSVEAVPLKSRWSSRAMAGGVPVPTFDMSEYHRTAVGYRYLTYKMLSFDFETCACALWTAFRFALLPTSNQSGGDDGILTSDRFGVVDANGFKGGA